MVRAIRMHVLAASLTSLAMAVSPAFGMQEVEFANATTNVTESATMVSVQVVLSAVAATDVTIPYTIGGSATAADATVTVGPLVIPAGQTTGTIDATILQDALSEGRERVTLDMGIPTGATLGSPSLHELIIDDDEPAATITFDLGGQTAAEGAGVVTASLTLSAPRTEPARVSFTQTGTATPSGGDVTVTPASPVIIAPGATTASLDLAIVSDAIDEADETLVLSLLLPNNSTLGGITQHTLTITDDDPPPTVGFAASSTAILETAPMTSVTVELDEVSSFDVTVPVTAAGTATLGTDYTFAPTSLVILAGTQSGTIDFTPIDDSAVEGTEIATLTLGTPTGATLGAATSHEFRLIDDEGTPPDVSFEQSSSLVPEEIGAVGIVVKASDYAAVPIVIPVGLGGTATVSADYTFASPTITIPVGSLTATATLTVIDDLDAEASETVVLTLGSPGASATVGTPSSYVLTIEDNDGVPTADFALATSAHSEAAGTVSVAVVLSGPAPMQVSIPVTFGGTAALAGEDAEVLANPLIIPMGAMGGQFDIVLEADALYENDETILFTMGTPTGADLGALTTHELTIEDDDPLPVVQFTGFRNVVDETAGAYALRFELDTASGLDVSAPFVVTGEASGPGDISFPPGPAVIAAGETFVDVPITIVVDNVPEIGETVLFSLGAPVDAEVGSIGSHLVLIADGAFGGGLNPGTPPLTASETELTFPLTRVGETSPPQTIFFSNLHSAPVTLTGAIKVGAMKGDYDITFPAGVPFVVDPGQSTSAEVTFTPLTRGARMARVRSDQAGNGASAAFIDLSGLAIGSPGEEVLMNADAAGYIAPSREYWTPEYGQTGGTLTRFNTTIAGTTFDPLYQSVRFGPSFGYALEVPNGRYAVQIRAWEPVKSAPGQRLMDVLLEGAVAIDDLDIFAEVGGNTAYVSPAVEVDVTDGVLDIDFQGVLAQALVSALEVRSVPMLSTATSTLDFGTVDQSSSATFDVVFQNGGLQAGTIDSVTFRVGTLGDARDFRVSSAGTNFSGSTTTVVRSTNISLPPGTTMVPVTFEPTFHQDHDITIEFESSATGDVFIVQAIGTGGAEAGWGFLHPVPDSRPTFVIDYDKDGTETVDLLGAESHTHEPGHSLVGFDWKIDGVPTSTAIDFSHVFSVGSSTVSLTVADNNGPANTATDTRLIEVYPVDAVPGSLVEYYDGSVTSEIVLLDNLPAAPDYISRLQGLSLEPNGMTIGASPLTDHAMVRFIGMFEITTARTLEFVAIGGAGHRVYVDNVLQSGPVALAAGSHDIDVRFAVTSLADLPVRVEVMEGGSRAMDIESSIAHDEESIAPVIHAMPSIGSDLGGNRIEIMGFGFFPESQTVVHWGATDFTSVQFDEWGGESIILTTPPGSGTISVTVETPQGISEAFPYSYSPTGPIPVRFTLLTDREVIVPTATSAAWGPDGRLYVSTLDGEIYALTYNDDWIMSNMDQYAGVSNLTNRDTLAIAFNPFDAYDPQDPTSIKLYISHGEQFQNGGGAFTGPSYFTGQVSTLTGPDFDNVQPLITQLPVSNHDHSVNGLLFDDNGDLLLCVGGNTNAGVQKPLLGDIPESPLSGAIIRARLSKPGFNGMLLYRDSATGVFVDDQVFGEQVDVDAGIDLEVYAAGFRNSVDLLLHTNGFVFATDNGPNPGYGVGSTGLVTDDGDEAIYFQDELNLIECGVYYGGANRSRGRYDARQSIFRSRPTPSIPGEYRRAILDLDSSTNGLTEYRGTAFNSGMRGDVIAMKWGFGLYRVELTADGRRVQSSTLYDNQNNSAFLPNRGLDVVYGPGGALIAADYIGNRVRVQVPDDVAAIGPTPYDISPWRVPAVGGQRFVIGGVHFGTNAGQVSVTVGG